MSIIRKVDILFISVCLMTIGCGMGLVGPYNGQTPDSSVDAPSDAEEQPADHDAGEQPADHDAGEQPSDHDADSTPAATCNNQVIEAGETCDSDTVNCADLNSSLWKSGTATCNAECKAYITTQCVPLPPPPQPVDLGAEPNTYLDYSQITELIKSWAQAGPEILQVGNYGQVGGYDNHYLRLSAAVSDSSLNLPKVMIDACIHGDEWIATALLLAVIHRLVEQYAVDNTITTLIQTRDIYFVPVTSPASYDQRNREEEGQDPNRSFPGPGALNNQPTSSVANLMAFFVDKGFNATLNFHASGRMVLLPWAYTEALFEEGNDGAKHRTLANKMANAATYRWGSVPDMVGYTAEGSSIDWFYVEGQKRGFNTCTMGVEAGTSKMPAESQISTEANRDYTMIVDFISEAPVLLTKYGDRVPDITPPVYDTPSPYFVPGLE